MISVSIHLKFVEISLLIRKYNFVIEREDCGRENVILFLSFSRISPFNKLLLTTRNLVIDPISPLFFLLSKKSVVNMLPASIKNF